MTPAEAIYGQELQPNFLSWLNSMGLAFDPFAILDAGADPNIPAYLVDHTAFAQLWGDWPTFVFAPAGGGKTAFRARLTRACRIGEDGRRVFPIVYHRLPYPDQVDDGAYGQDIHLKNILRQAAQELLFLFAYRPRDLNALDEVTIATLRRILDENLPSPLQNYLTRLLDAGDLSPLAQEFDRTASYLLNPPGSQDLARFCERLVHVPVYPVSAHSHMERFKELIYFLRKTLHFEAIYLLVDGVDAYPETAADSNTAVSLLRWILDRTPEWMTKQVFVKFFLPIDLESVVSKLQPRLLTEIAKGSIILWSEDDLVQVIRTRLSFASGGMFDSLDMMSDPGLRSAEKELARWVHPAVPREVLVLTERLLIEHVQRSGKRGKLEPEDLDAAHNWYARQVATAHST